MSIDLTEVYRSLDPLSPLEPDSELYVERPDNPMDRVAVELKLSDRPRHYLLVGHRGTGKTTELRRLAHALTGDRNVLYVDVGETADLTDSTPDELLGQALQASLGRNLETSVSTEPPVSKSGKWRQQVAHLLDAVKTLGESDIPVVAVLDGLERLEKDDDIHYALAADPPLHSWPLSVICTIPLSVYLSEVYGEHFRYFDRSVFLPGVATCNRDGEPDDQGAEALASIVRRRAGEDAFEPEALRALVPYSAGIHRELLQLAQRACVVAALGGAKRVSPAHAEAAIVEQRNEYSIMLRTRDYPFLEKVMKTKQLPGGDDVARLIRNQLIVAYANGTTWFDVHPILRPLVEREVPVSGGGTWVPGW